MPAGVVLVPKLKLGNADLEAPASSLAKLELRLRGSQAGAWEPEEPINGVANLVLACTDCNRGVNGKFAHLPALPLLQRLHERNEYLITSHHPLRETLLVQTGCSTRNANSFCRMLIIVQSLIMISIKNGNHHSKVLLFFKGKMLGGRLINLLD